MLVFYCNFLQEKYVQSWNLLNVPRTSADKVLTVVFHASDIDCLHCRVLSLSDCKYSLDPFNQTQIDEVRLNLVFTAS